MKPREAVVLVMELVHIVQLHVRRRRKRGAECRRPPLLPHPVGFVKVIVLENARHERVAFVLHQPVPHLFDVVFPDVEVQIRAGIERRVQKLECVRARDEHREARLQVAERDGVIDEALQVAVDVVRPEVEVLHALVREATCAPEADASTRAESRIYPVVDRMP